MTKVCLKSENFTCSQNWAVGIICFNCLKFTYIFKCNSQVVCCCVSKLILCIKNQVELFSWLRGPGSSVSKLKCNIFILIFYKGLSLSESWSIINWIGDCAGFYRHVVFCNRSNLKICFLKFTHYKWICTCIPFWLIITILNLKWRPWSKLIEAESFYRNIICSIFTCKHEYLCII